MSSTGISYRAFSTSGRSGSGRCSSRKSSADATPSKSRAEKLSSSSNCPQRYSLSISSYLFSLVSSLTLYSTCMPRRTASLSCSTCHRLTSFADYILKNRFPQIKTRFSLSGINHCLISVLYSKSLLTQSFWTLYLRKFRVNSTSQDAFSTQQFPPCVFCRLDIAGKLVVMDISHIRFHSEVSVI